MNKARRKEIKDVIARLKKFNFEFTELEKNECIDLIKDILDDEEYARENIPENLQNSYRYQQSEDACDNLDDAIAELHCIRSSNKKENNINIVENAITFLNNASE